MLQAVHSSRAVNRTACLHVCMDAGTFIVGAPPPTCLPYVYLTWLMVPGLFHFLNFWSHSRFTCTEHTQKREIPGNEANLFHLCVLFLDAHVLSFSSGLHCRVVFLVSLHSNCQPHFLINTHSAHVASNEYMPHIYEYALKLSIRVDSFNVLSFWIYTVCITYVYFKIEGHTPCVLLLLSPIWRPILKLD